jgi:tRNA threonylcarbamoyl adenosine modification protein (Sua5/YciO/YrdC/YwlC family)
MTGDSHKWLKVDEENPDPEIIRKAVNVIRCGGIVILPTDTAYGLAGNPADPITVNRIMEIKERRGKAGMPVLAADVSQVLGTAELEGVAYDLAMQFWPGALTLILPTRRNLPEGVQGPGGTLAVRVPNHPVALQIIYDVGSVVTGTSANRSGEPSPHTAKAAYSQVGEQVDLVLDAGRTHHRSASTIIDCTVEPFKLVRRGAVSEEALRSWLSK